MSAVSDIISFSKSAIGWEQHKVFANESPGPAEIQREIDRQRIEMPQEVVVVPIPPDFSLEDYLNALSKFTDGDVDAIWVPPNDWSGYTGVLEYREAFNYEKQEVYYVNKNRRNRGQEDLGFSYLDRGTDKRLPAKLRKMKQVRFEEDYFSRQFGQPLQMVLIEGMRYLKNKEGFIYHPDEQFRQQPIGQQVAYQDKSGVAKNKKSVRIVDEKYGYDTFQMVSKRFLDGIPMYVLSSPKVEARKKGKVETRLKMMFYDKYINAHRRWASLTFYDLRYKGNLIPTSTNRYTAPEFFNIYNPNISRLFVYLFRTQIARDLFTEFSEYEDTIPEGRESAQFFRAFDYGNMDMELDLFPFFNDTIYDADDEIKGFVQAKDFLGYARKKRTKDSRSVNPVQPLEKVKQEDIMIIKRNDPNVYDVYAKVIGERINDQIPISTGTGDLRIFSPTGDRIIPMSELRQADINQLNIRPDFISFREPDFMLPPGYVIPIEDKLPERFGTGGLPEKPYEDTTDYSLLEELDEDADTDEEEEEEDTDEEPSEEDQAYKFVDFLDDDGQLTMEKEDGVRTFLNFKFGDNISKQMLEEDDNPYSEKGLFKRLDNLYKFRKDKASGKNKITTTILKFMKEKGGNEDPEFFAGMDEEKIIQIFFRIRKGLGLAEVLQ